MPTEYSQEKLNERFDRESQIWRERYEAVEDSPWRYNDKLYRRHYTLELLGEGKGRQVLDLGCGAGSYVKSLNRLGYQVVAMDAAEEMVQLAAEETAKLDGNGLALRGDALNLPFADNTFDALLAVGLLEYLPDDEEFLTKIGRVLKPGGRAVVTLRNERCAERRLWRFYKKCGVDIYRANYWYREHKPAEFEGLLGKLGFTNVERRYCHFYPFTWPLGILLKPVNAVIANQMEHRFSQSETDWLASTYVVAFDKAGDLPEPKTLDSTGFAEILRCPKTGSALREATDEEIASLRAKTANSAPQRALLTTNQKWAYPILGSAPELVDSAAIAF